MMNNHFSLLHDFITWGVQLSIAVAHGLFKTIGSTSCH